MRRLQTFPPSPQSRGANGLGGLPVSLAVVIEVSFSLLYHPPPRHAPVARQFAFEVQSRGGSLAAIAQETAPNSNRRFQQQHRVDFPILNDPCCSSRVL